VADNPEFQIGLVMAGAISAGAYSAGVTDFIMEALDAYMAAKEKPGWQGPRHDVRIPVMAGASAGGMTAAIAALHVFHGLEHVWPGKPAPAKAANRLYSSWVTDISIEGLLETSDLTGGRDRQGVKSALCCDVLTRIVDDAFNLSGPLRIPPWIGRGDDRTLRLLLTVTNLRGVPYSFALFGANANDRYGMLNHGDYLDFTVGISPSTNPGSHALDIASTTGDEWNLFKTTALATGAFPIGLAPRRLQRPPSDYANGGRVGVDDAFGGFKTIPPDNSFNQVAPPFAFTSVDGGTIDNEPLELARRCLAGAGAHNKRDGEEADKAVVLVAPFPNFVHVPDDNPGDTLVHVIPQLASALVDQARFKPDELAMAENDAIFSRFIISPIRPANNNPLAVKYPIASGPLSGFGGFLHESFRRHDYLLGRRNAQAFLRWNFALPATNPLFKDFHGNRDAWYIRDVGEGKGTIAAKGDVAGPLKMFARGTTLPPDTPGLPIIPLTDALRQPIEIGPVDLPQPDSISRPDLNARIRKRAEAVVATLVDIDLISVTQNMHLGSLLRLGARQYGTEMVSKKASEFVNHAIDEVAGAFSSPQGG
jgi:hypothetical protein